MSRISTAFVSIFCFDSVFKQRAIGNARVDLCGKWRAREQPTTRQFRSSLFRPPYDCTWVRRLPRRRRRSKRLERLPTPSRANLLCLLATFETKFTFAVQAWLASMGPAAFPLLRCFSASSVTVEHRAIRVADKSGSLPIPSKFHKGTWLSPAQHCAPNDIRVPA
jgi:hypothetical protein